jgi:hypothetical protein
MGPVVDGGNVLSDDLCGAHRLPRLVNCAFGRKDIGPPQLQYLAVD